MQIANSRLKHLVFDVIAFTDELDENGKRVARTSWTRAHAPAASSLKAKLVADVIVSEDGNTWLSTKDDKPEKFSPKLEKFSDNAIELTEKEVDAIRFFYNQLEEVADYGSEAFALLDELLATK